MNAADLDALYAQAQDEAVDGFVRERFGTQPVADLSGMFTGRSSLAVAPAPAAGANEPPTSTMPTIHQGPRAAAPSDDARFEAYMDAYFPSLRRR